MDPPQEQPESTSDSPICVWENEQFTRRRLAQQRENANTIDLRTPPQSGNTSPDSTVTPPFHAYVHLPIRRYNSNQYRDYYGPPPPKKTFTRRRLAQQRENANTIDLRTPPQSGNTSPDSTVTPPFHAYVHLPIRRYNSNQYRDYYGPPPPKKPRDPYSCPICMDDVIGREPTTTKCGHLFCKECIVRAIDSCRKCPVCNTQLTVRNIQRVYI